MRGRDEVALSLLVLLLLALAPALPVVVVAALWLAMLSASFTQTVWPFSVTAEICWATAALRANNKVITMTNVESERFGITKPSLLAHIPCVLYPRLESQHCPSWGYNEPCSTNTPAFTRNAGTVRSFAESRLPEYSYYKKQANRLQSVERGVSIQ